MLRYIPFYLPYLTHLLHFVVHRRMFLLRKNLVIQFETILVKEGLISVDNHVQERITHPKEHTLRSRIGHSIVLVTAR